MAHAYLPITNERLFRRFLPWFLVSIALLLAIAFLCIVVALNSGSAWWLVVVILVFAIVAEAQRYHAHALVVNDTHIICQRGVFTIRRYSIPLWRLEVESNQGPFGQIFQYGTVRLRGDFGVVEFRQMGELDAFFALVEQRQTLLFRAAAYSSSAYMYPIQSP